MKLILSFLFVLCTITVSLSQLNNDTTIKLDSVVYEFDLPLGFDNAVQRFNYDNSGSILSSITEFSKLQLKQKIEYGFDKGIETRTICLFNYDLQLYENNEKIVLDTKGLEEIETQYVWSSNSMDWIEDVKVLTYFNKFNLEDSMFIYNWNENTKEWILGSSNSSKYDLEGKILSEVYKLYSDIDTSIYPRSYFYDERELLKYMERYEDNKRGGELELAYRIENKYDSLGNLISQSDDDENYSGIHYYTYDSLNNLVSKKDIDIHDNQIESYVEVKYDYMTPIANVNIKGYEDNYPYTFSPLLYKPISFHYQGLEFDENNELVPFYADGIFYYSDKNITAISNEKINKPHYYPNPTGSTIQVSEEVTQTTVLNVYGKSLLISKTETVDVSSLPNGSYIILLETDKGLVSEKLLISK